MNYKQFNIDFNTEHLLEVFQSAKKVIKARPFIDTETAPLLNDPEVARLLALFPMIEPDPQAIALQQLKFDMRPYINPGNNGLILFPVFGVQEYSFYSYSAPVVDGRLRLDPSDPFSAELASEVQSTLTDTVLIDKPTMINGTIPHSYKLTNFQNPVCLVFKIPLAISWEEIVEATKNL